MLSCADSGKICSPAPAYSASGDSKRPYLLSTERYVVRLATTLPTTHLPNGLEDLCCTNYGRTSTPETPNSAVWRQNWEFPSSTSPWDEKGTLSIVNPSNSLWGTRDASANPYHTVLSIIQFMVEPLQMDLMWSQLWWPSSNVPSQVRYLIFWE